DAPHRWGYFRGTHFIEWPRVAWCAGELGGSLPGGGHVDLGAEAQPRGAAIGIEVEDHPLALAQRPEDRPVERAARQVELLEADVGEHAAVTGAGVVGLDHPLHDGAPGQASSRRG